MPIDALTPMRLAARMRRSEPKAKDAFRFPRPDGSVLWAHAPGTLSAGPLLDLRNRMMTRLKPMSVVRTGLGPERETNLTTPGTVMSEPVPETLPRIEAFLDHWEPDACIWTGALTPALLLDGAIQRDVPLFWVNPVTPEPASPREARVVRHLLSKFTFVHAVDEPQAAAIRELGPPTVEKSGPFNDVQRPLRCNETERQEFAEILGTRPVWAAIAPSATELELVLKAHAQSLPTAHRLLLVIVVDDPREGLALTDRLTQDGWRVGCRENDDMPGNSVEIYVAGSDEFGLWYQISHLCFLGGTLTDGARYNPMEAAALGVALIAGPEGGEHTDTLNRLERAAAMHRLTKTDSLGQVVSDLIAPDRLAVLAHRAWDVSTDGADLGDRLADQLCDAIETRRTG